MTFPKSSFAFENPLSVPNNKFGIHILFPSEIGEAAKLVNSSGGDWGYVVIPIQSKDKDLDKWQKFMDEAKEFHVIPIIRLATEGDYFNTSVWAKPTFEDVLDFANFLTSLDWPTKNKYVVIFNEPNRSDEWVGQTNPGEYAQILNYAVEVFKSRSEDYFIISAGLDNAASNLTGQSINEYDFIEKMNDEVPGIFGLIDGLGSHSYPNPGFRQPPSVFTAKSIYSFFYEKKLVYRLSGKNLPVFITETGWSKDYVSESEIASYYINAFRNVWSDEDIVTVSPFLLQAGDGPFSQFSLTTSWGKSKIYEAIEKMHKIRGKPQPQVTFYPQEPKNLSSTIANKRFIDQKLESVSLQLPSGIKQILKWFLGYK